MIRVDRKLNSTDVVDALTDLFIFQKSGLKPPTSVGKDPTVRRRRSKPLNPSTLVGGGSVCVEHQNTYGLITAQSLSPRKSVIGSPLWAPKPPTLSQVHHGKTVTVRALMRAFEMSC